MDYQESIDYINKLYIGKTQQPTLDRMKKVLDVLEFEDDIKAIHVAGTNGKGSTCSMIAKVLQESGYKVGLYTSPHLVDINERIKINGINISNDDFSYYVTKVVDATKKINIELLFFEVLTVVAFLYFKKQQCDIVVLETGMGGEYDATNIIKKPICTVITNIGLEHEDILGKGIESIAKAKAGIMKSDVQCVLYDIKDGKEIFEKVAKEKKAILHIANFDNIIVNYNNKNSISNTNTFSYKKYTDISTNLIGDHQIKNACVVLEIIDILKENGYTIGDDNIRSALNNIYWPARFQILQDKKGEPTIILDGGHNPQCIDAIVHELKKYNDKNIVFVVSIVKDKNVDLMAKELSSISKKFVLSHIDNKRGMEEEELKNIFLKYSDDVTYKYDIKDSIKFAKDKAKSEGIVCIIGSLYFAGDVLKIM